MQLRPMWGIWVTTLQWSELVVSAVLHLAYGFYILTTAVVSDASIAPADCSPKKVVSSDGAAPTHIPPVVLVHGIFGFGKGRMGGLSYFGGAESKHERVLVPDLGSLTSLHDRARQLFFYLKGGLVDFGEEHSKDAGHSRFGRVYEEGQYPEWDEDHPLHFVGHSAGAQVVRLLQQMLADKAFDGFSNTSERWVISITSISGAFNGSTRTYLDGMQPGEWKSMRPVCLLQLCRIGICVYEWLDIKWMKEYYSFGFDHFHMSWRKTGARGLVELLLGNSGPFASADWILPDLTLQGSAHMNSHIHTFPSTFYFSYATKRTTKFLGATLPSRLLSLHPLLFLRTLQMSLWTFPSHLQPPYEGYRDEEWRDNDGALNTVSMTHPRTPSEHPHCAVSTDSEKLEPGIWYYKIVEADHLLFILNRERAGVEFDLMYEGIFERCRMHTLENLVPDKVLPDT